MAEGLTVGESVSVQVTRANPLGAGSVPTETIIVVVGVIVAIVLIAIAVMKYKGTGSSYTGRASGPTGKRRIWKSLAVAGILGFAAFLLSGNLLSWVMATGLFYYEFRIRSSADGQ